MDNKSLKWRIGVVALVLLFSTALVLPTFVDNLPSWWPKKKVSLGLDLKGGIHLVMGADLNVVLQNTAARQAEELRRALAEKSITAISVAKGEGLEIAAEFPDESAMKEAEALLKDNFGNLTILRRPAANRLVLTMTEAEIRTVKEMTARQALETIRNRVDMFGVAEPDIRPQGEDRIVIQLPGMDDPKRAVALIGKTALLEFKLVDRDRTPEWAQVNGVPAGMELQYGREIARDGSEVRVPYLLRKQSLMTGEGLVDARVSRGQFNEPQVAITFDSRGARQFERVTGEYTGYRMAIVLDNMVYSAPNINERIGGGRAVISGAFSEDEARDLAVALRAGALPAPVSVLEERTVGPTLGADSIQMGLRAGVIGLGLVLVFMAVYYRWSGVVADAALLFNFPIILAVLATFGATLTLPGIFGLILTLGMAVDANVLVFERIREEIRSGKTPKAAVGAGFGRAFWTVFDSNLTTLITALVLYQFGSGPIRGFAVTLSVGILSSMFTALFFSRVVFDTALSGRRAERLSI
ncbi:protein translocase subunit SecD [Deltaproteobacteria bacterium Smac51]|nr:protein translocase subunit SecD [Deltaproteobacteria bacterium Smac51]